MTGRYHDFFNNVTTGVFKDNTAGDIGADDVRDLVDTTLLDPDTLTADGNTTGVSGKHYTGSIAAFTADRDFTLPVASGVGERIRVTLTTGDDTYALVIKGVATVTINNGSAATEWSRLFISSESLMFESTSTTNWQVIVDKRISCKCWMYSDNNNVATLTWNGANLVRLYETETSIGDMEDETNGIMNIRRTGQYIFAVNARITTDSSGGTGSTVSNLSAIGVMLRYDSGGGTTPATNGSLLFIHETEDRTVADYVNVSMMPLTLQEGSTVGLRVTPYHSGTASPTIYTQHSGTTSPGNGGFNQPQMFLIEVL